MTGAAEGTEATESVEVDDASAVDEGGASATVASLDAELLAVTAQRDEYLETLQRVQAEFANYKKRVERDQAEMSERATERLLDSLLPVLDSFDLALVNLPVEARGGDSDAAKLRKGVELVFAEFLSVLERAGIEKMAADGCEFDPNEHEAVMQVDAEEAREHPVVVETMRPGYRLHGRVLRAAMVKVAR